MTLPAFEYAKSTLRWANEELEKFHIACQEFLDSKPYSHSTYAGPITGQRVTFIRVKNHPGDDLLRGSYRIAGDLRNVLDQATCAASSSIGTTKPDKTNFPSGQNLTDLRARLAGKKGPFCGIPVELYQRFEDLQPFPYNPITGEGNAPLTALIRMTNPNKHRISLRLGVDLSSMGIEAMKNVEFELQTLEDGNLVRWYLHQMGLTQASKRWSFATLAL